MSTEATLYGISNCDTIRKARGWLREQGIEYRFHDYRKDGIDDGLLRRMKAQLGWETLLNRRGTTWRALPEADRSGLDEASALRLMRDHPALIRRPILEFHGRLHIAFSDQQYREIFGPA